MKKEDILALGFTERVEFEKEIYLFRPIGEHLSFRVYFGQSVQLFDEKQSKVIALLNNIDIKEFEIVVNSFRTNFN